MKIEAEGVPDLRVLPAGAGAGFPYPPTWFGSSALERSFGIATVFGLYAARGGHEILRHRGVLVEFAMRAASSIAVPSRDRGFDEALLDIAGRITDRDHGAILHFHGSVMMVRAMKLFRDHGRFDANSWCDAASYFLKGSGCEPAADLRPWLSGRMASAAMLHRALERDHADVVEGLWAGAYSGAPFDPAPAMLAADEIEESGDADVADQVRGLAAALLGADRFAFFRDTGRGR